LLAQRLSLFQAAQTPPLGNDSCGGVWQNKPVFKEVMETVEAMANRLYEPRPKKKRKKKAVIPE